MTLRDRARGAADKVIVQRAVEQPSLASITSQIDRAEDAHPQNAELVALWAQGHAEIVAPGRASAMAAGVCEYARMLYSGNATRIASDTTDLDVTAADIEAAERVEDAFWKRMGNRKGTLAAAIAELKRLHPSYVSSEELETAEKILLAVGERLERPAKEAGEKWPSDSDDKTSNVPVRNQMGETLMSLMLAIGYGPRSHSYSIKRAAELVAKLARLHGFELSVTKLQNIASERRKKPD